MEGVLRDKKCVPIAGMQRYHGSHLFHAQGIPNLFIFSIQPQNNPREGEKLEPGPFYRFNLTPLY